MPPSDVSPEALAATLGPAEGLLLVLDHDGTLSPIAPTPEAARLAPGARDALTRLGARTIVAVVSGRSLDDLARRLDGLPVTLCANHGVTLRHPDGREEWLIDRAAAVRALEDIAPAIEGLIGDEPGWLVERKDASLAVHHRLADPDVVARLLPGVVALLASHGGTAPGFTLLHGHAVVELRPVGMDKGRAVAALVEAHPGLRVVAVGDDVTDEDAFAAALARDGVAVIVGDHGATTRAPWRLAAPEDVIALLDGLR